jgi:hypothetical protein
MVQSEMDMRLTSLPISLVLLCGVAFPGISVASPTEELCALPLDLKDVVSKRFPKSHVTTLEDLGPDSKDLFVKEHSGHCPGFIAVDFYGDGKPTWALALTSMEGARNKVRLVVAHKTDAGLETRVLESTDGAPVIWSEGPGKYDDIYGQKKIRAKWPVIIFCGYYSWAIVYAWNGTAVQKVWLSD